MPLIISSEEMGNRNSRFQKGFKVLGTCGEQDQLPPPSRSLASGSDSVAFPRPIMLLSIASKPEACTTHTHNSFAGPSPLSSSTKRRRRGSWTHLITTSTSPLCLSFRPFLSSKGCQRRRRFPSTNSSKLISHRPMKSLPDKTSTSSTFTSMVCEGPSTCTSARKCHCGFKVFAIMSVENVWFAMVMEHFGSEVVEPRNAELSWISIGKRSRPRVIPIISKFGSPLLRGSSGK